MKKNNENNFKYCPKCGSNSFISKGDGFLCMDCEFRLYINASAAVAAIIVDNKGNILLAIRGKEPQKGTYDLPGGFIDIGETAEEALKREIKEELDLDVIESNFLASFPNTYHYKGMTYYPLDIGFVCKVDGMDHIKALDDVAGIEFIKPTDIDLTKIGFESARKMVKTYCNTLK